MESEDNVQAEIKKLEALNELEGIEDTALPALIKEHYSRDNPSQIVITSKHLEEFKRRWLYRLSKRKDRAMIKMAKIKAHFDRQREVKNEHDLKAYKTHDIVDLVKLVIYCLFTAFMAIYAPSVLPEIIGNFIG